MTRYYPLWYGEGKPMRKRILRVFVTLCVIPFSFSCERLNLMDLYSPDGKIQVTVSTKGLANQQSLVYRIAFNGTPVIGDSRLGVILKDIGTLCQGFSVMDVIPSSVDETYKIPFGKSSEVRNHYNEAAFHLTDKSGIVLIVIFRVYNDGIAFRYYFPEQESLTTLEITGELTRFNFLGNHRYWGLHVPSLASNYETNYTTSYLAYITVHSLMALPLLVKVSDSIWVGLAEANLTDYAGMYLRGMALAHWTLKSILSPLPNDPKVCIKAKTPHASPWRVIMIADNPGRLIESNIILNLNEPCKLPDISWIKPGKTDWPYWNGHVVEGVDFEGGLNPETMKYYIDFCAEYGIDYHAVTMHEGKSWYGPLAEDFEPLEGCDTTIPIPELDMVNVLDYAKEKEIGIELWVHWKSLKDNIEEAFTVYEQWGIHGLMVDFMNRDDQEMVNFYHDVLKKAAEHHLTISFHGAYKPTGIRRTYPHLIAREGVLNLEYNKLFRRCTPEHDVTVPFTRMLAGPLDYHLGAFRHATKQEFIPQDRKPMVMGTRCHQLAMYVVYENTLQKLCDNPASFRNQTGFEFILEVPTSWDETRVLKASPGDYIVIARRYGSNWYMGSMTDWSKREISVKLDFLDKGDYIAEIYVDGDDADINPASVKKSTVLVNAQQEMTITMAPGGGHAARFHPDL